MKINGELQVHCDNYYQDCDYSQECTRDGEKQCKYWHEEDFLCNNDDVFNELIARNISKSWEDAKEAIQQETHCINPIQKFKKGPISL